MSKIVEFEIFRFDAQNDYLPYFKKYKIITEKNQSLKEIFESIKQEDPFFSFLNDINSYVKINGKTVYINTKINHLYIFFGKRLKCTPLHLKRVTKDLIIDNKDFQDRFYLFNNITTIDDKLYYDSLINFHYASDVIKYKDDYIGDASLIFAHYLINKYPNKKEEILKIISCKNNGIWFHSDISEEVFPYNVLIEKKIIDLFTEIVNTKPFLNSFCEEMYVKTRKLG